MLSLYYTIHNTHLSRKTSSSRDIVLSLLLFMDMLWSLYEVKGTVIQAALLSVLSINKESNNSLPCLGWWYQLEGQREVIISRLTFYIRFNALLWERHGSIHLHDKWIKWSNKETRWSQLWKGGGGLVIKMGHSSHCGPKEDADGGRPWPRVKPSTTTVPFTQIGRCGTLWNEEL